MSDCTEFITADELLTSNRILHENIQGGEKTKSEWEQLESLSKDELIIELVKMRYQFRNILEVLGDLSDTGARRYIYADGRKPSEEWMHKIFAYAEKHLESGDEMYSCTLQRYGVDEKTAETLCGEDIEEES